MFSSLCFAGESVGIQDEQEDKGLLGNVGDTLSGRHEAATAPSR